MHKQTNFDIAELNRRWNRIPQSFELSMAGPRVDLNDDVSGTPVNLPAEFNDRTVLINLDGVTNINSWAIALFIEAMERITEYGGNLVLFGLRDNVRRMFETARLDQVFHIYSTREEALAAQN